MAFLFYMKLTAEFTFGIFPGDNFAISMALDDFLTGNREQIGAPEAAFLSEYLSSSLKRSDRRFRVFFCCEEFLKFIKICFSFNKSFFSSFWSRAFHTWLTSEVVALEVHGKRGYESRLSTSTVASWSGPSLGGDIPAEDSSNLGSKSWATEEHASNHSSGRLRFLLTTKHKPPNTFLIG